MTHTVNDEPHDLFELPYFDQSVEVFRTGLNYFDTLIGKNRPLETAILSKYGENRIDLLIQNASSQKQGLDLWTTIPKLQHLREITVIMTWQWKTEIVEEICYKKAGFGLFLYYF